jgi:hypothetical protein
LRQGGRRPKPLSTTTLEPFGSPQEPEGIFYHSSNDTYHAQGSNYSGKSGLLRISMIIHVAENAVSRGVCKLFSTIFPKETRSRSTFPQRQ